MRSKANGGKRKGWYDEAGIRFGYVLSSPESIYAIIKDNPSFESVELEDVDGNMRVVASTQEGKQFTVKRLLKTNQNSMWYELDLQDIK
jgi:hypothetical protein